MVAWRADDGPGKEDLRKRRLALLAARPLERVRVDALPEHTDYRDTGCDAAPSCLRCPFAHCKYDARGGRRSADARTREREIALLHRRYNAPPETLARTYGLTLRSIYRILHEPLERN
jgi:hypothetical protein